jgi:hypothetical protein
VALHIIGSDNKRLTMKYLFQLINEIQQDKQLLQIRVNELELQLYELFQIRDDAAASVESPNIETVIPSDVPEAIQITRAQRHPKPPKKSFIRFWSRK